jgi:hypothetical protein
LQTQIVPDMAAGRLAAAEFRRRYRQLSDLQLVKQLARDTDDDLAPEVSPERLIEAVQRCEEDLTGQVPTVIQPLRAIVRFGEAIPVEAGRRPDHAALVDRARAAVEDLLTRERRAPVARPAAEQPLAVG